MSNNNIKFSFAGILVLLLIFGISFSYYNFNKPLIQKEIKDSPFSIYSEDKKENLSESKDWYEMKITYPKNNSLISNEVFKLWQDFANEHQLKKFNTFEEAKEGLGISMKEARYNFIADYKLYKSSTTLSYVFQIYYFTGGAHGATMLYPITIGEDGKVIPVEEILKNDKLIQVSKIVEADLKKQKKQRNISSGLSEKEAEDMSKNDTFLTEGIKPVRENYSSVWYEDEDIVISFGQYQVASYAEGMFEVRIPKASLN